MQITSSPLFNQAPVAPKAASAQAARNDVDTPATDNPGGDGGFARLLISRQKAAVAKPVAPIKVAPQSTPVYADPRAGGTGKPGAGLIQGSGPVVDPRMLPVSDDPPATPATGSAADTTRTDATRRLAAADEKSKLKADPLPAGSLEPRLPPIEEPEDAEPAPDQPIKVPTVAIWPGPPIPLPPAEAAAVAAPVRTDGAADASKIAAARNDRLAAGSTNGIAGATVPSTITPPLVPTSPSDGRGPIESQPVDNEPISLTPDSGEDAPPTTSAPGKRPLFDSPIDMTGRLEGVVKPLIVPNSGGAPSTRAERSDEGRRNAAVEIAAKSELMQATAPEDASRATSREGARAAEGRSFADTLSAIGAPGIDATPRSNDPGTAPVQATIDTPATSPEFREALGVQVSLLVADGVQTAELHLNPADMGPISVQIVTDGTQAKVDFGADSAATRQIIESGLPELASALRDAGITLTGGGVSSGASNGQASDGSGDRSRGVSRRITIDGGDLGTVPAVRSQNPGPRGQVDLYA